VTPPTDPARQRVPPWVFPVLLALPLWAVLYGGAFGERVAAERTPVQLGRTLYRSAGCSGCHGSNGQGSPNIPGLTSTTKTFPDINAHIAWVSEGSLNKKGEPYGAQGRIAGGGMPGFGQQLTAEEVLAVVCYERVVVSRQDPPPAQCDPPSETAARG
jgi:mono/diheme cytochrome c family protein